MAGSYKYESNGADTSAYILFVFLVDALQRIVYN